MTAATLPKPDHRSIDIRPGRALGKLELGELWRYRELLYFLILRELKIRYRQAAIGAAWALIQPIMTVAIFSVVFGHFAKMPSGGVPYPIFAFTAVLPWMYFAEAVRRGSTGLVADSDLIRKIYFPRLLVPLAMVAAPLIDFAAGFAVLLVILAFYQVPITLYILLLPLFLLVALSLSLSVALWLGPLSVRFRDVMHALPFAIQVWMYASPIAYPMAIVPERWRLLYSLNPMVGVIEGFRWVLLRDGHPDFRAIAISCVIISACLVGGLVYFKKMERSFADVI
ncbi:lipopolysaccharide transport system permease protein [Caulobacter rhizosphaerae]|uniref:Transport permease protein n=1 Tax=Caulobacter rhizosphaerae TaxID=2010972 RepID=A0ABU1N1X2_9CAUL|nr:ABC transporter permease [Caulobacter rhizosphaerae]MDR6532267.1 lipopolysaccharide transport system permease protein [Caulobacter rhizosphaerae]